MTTMQTLLLLEIYEHLEASRDVALTMLLLLDSTLARILQGHPRWSDLAWTSSGFRTPSVAT